MLQIGLWLGDTTPPAVLIFTTGAAEVPTGTVLFEILEIVLNTWTEETGLTVSVMTITAVGEVAAGAETTSEETIPPADEAETGEATIEEAMIDEGITG